MSATRTSAGFLLGLGNLKLGENTYTWSLPPIKTCPGRSQLCEDACYAMKGHLRLQVENGNYGKKYEESKRLDFSKRVIDEIRFRGCAIVRIHVAGDFYSPAYTRQWIKIVSLCRKTRFFVYTRSWRSKKIRRELNKLAEMKNLRLWFSCDKETGVPENVPSRVRVAYMAIDDLDIPEVSPDLVFRVRRKTVKKRLGGVLVCPAENGISGHVHCSRCELCQGRLEEKDPRRFSLSVIH